MKGTMHRGSSILRPLAGLLFLFTLFASGFAAGDKTGVQNCPDFVPDDGSGQSRNHDGDPVPGPAVSNVCVDGARCCYRKHCPGGVCKGFCLRRPHDPYFVTAQCPAWTDGDDAWYAQGVFTGTGPPVAKSPPPSTGASKCPAVYTPADPRGGKTDALYRSSESHKCSRTSRCCYYLHCPANKCVFCLYTPGAIRSASTSCPRYDGRANLYNVPGVTAPFEPKT